MDNLVVGLTGATCFVMAQASTNWFDSMTPLGIVALVVYFFLWKFDRKLDVIEDTTKEMDKNLQQLIEKVKENEHE